MSGVIRHGHARVRTPTYNSWRAMIDRCTTSRSRKHAHYKCVSICQEWMESFEAFLRDMGERPAGTTIDRIDNAKGYLPGNCRWATQREQSLNTRRSRHLTSAAGETRTMFEWAAIAGIDQKLLGKRLRRGWSLEAALLPPLGPGRAGSTTAACITRKP